jgi:hypothetical protein
MKKLSFPVSVVMERVALQSRWQSETWQLAGVLPADPDMAGAGSATRVLVDRAGLRQVMIPGFEAVVYPDEAEGYFLNVTSAEPRIFVMWRLSEDGTDATPHAVTLSYNEAGRWMDAQEKVESVTIPENIYSELVAWVRENYRPPEKKERIRPRSFESKEGRYKGKLS